MKRLALLASTVLLIGCADTAVDTATKSDAPTPETSSTTPEPAASETDTEAIAVSFNAGETATLAIPEMHCPFGCFPKAQDALEQIDGIASIELVKQKEEGAIDDRRVVVTFDGSVDSKSAIAALDSVALPGASFETSETSDN